MEQGNLWSIALAVLGKDVLCMLMQAAPMQQDSGPKTLQASVDAHWHHQFTTCVYVVHGLMCVAFLGWRVPLKPVRPWYLEHMVKGGV